MKKILFKQFEEDGKKTYIYELPEEVELDEDALDLCEEGAVKSLVPMEYVDDADAFYYDLAGYKTLAKTLSGEVDASDVLELLYSMANAFVECKELGIPLSYLTLHKDFVFVDRVTMKTKFLCVPLYDEQESNALDDIAKFIRVLLSSLTYDISEDGSYVTKLLTLVNTSEQFNTSILVNALQDLMDDYNISYEIEDYSSDFVAEDIDDVTVLEDMPETVSVAEMEAEILREEEAARAKQSEPEEIITEPEVEAVEEVVAEPEVEPEEEVVAEPEVEPEEEVVAEPEVEAVEEVVVEPEVEAVEEVVAEPEVEAVEEVASEPEPKPEEEAIEEPEDDDSEEDDGDTQTLKDPEQAKAEIEAEIAAKEAVQPVFDSVFEPVIEALDGPLDGEIHGIPFGATAPKPMKNPAQSARIARAKAKAAEEEKARAEAEPSLLSQLEGKESTLPKVNPYLIRTNNEERIMITKQTFKIGKASFGMDYTVTDNGAISRNHCMILAKDGVYYIRDNKSTNHTYVNGEMVETGRDVLLTHESKIVIADEEFLFKLR